MAIDPKYTLNLVRKAEQRRAIYLITDVMPNLDGLLVSLDRLDEEDTCHTVQGVRDTLEQVAAKLKSLRAIDH